MYLVRNSLFLQVCPLTALKFAELAVKAGIPPGVINVLPGTGRECGQAIADHPLIRKLGFTGESVSDITATQKNMFLAAAQRHAQVVLLSFFSSFSFRLLALVSFCWFFTSATMV